MALFRKGIVYGAQLQKRGTAKKSSRGAFPLEAFVRGACAIQLGSSSLQARHVLLKIMMIPCLILTKNFELFEHLHSV